MSSTTQVRLKVRLAAGEVKTAVCRRIVTARRVWRRRLPLKSTEGEFRVCSACVESYRKLACALKLIDVEITFVRPKQSESAAITFAGCQCDGTSKGWSCEATVQGDVG